MTRARTVKLNMITTNKVLTFPIKSNSHFSRLFFKLYINERTVIPYLNGGAEELALST